MQTAQSILRGLLGLALALGLADAAVAQPMPTPSPNPAPPPSQADGQNICALAPELNCDDGTGDLANAGTNIAVATLGKGVPGLGFGNDIYNSYRDLNSDKPYDQAKGAIDIYGSIGSASEGARWVVGANPGGVMDGVSAGTRAAAMGQLRIAGKIIGCSAEVMTITLQVVQACDQYMQGDSLGALQTGVRAVTGTASNAIWPCHGTLIADGAAALGDWLASDPGPSQSEPTPAPNQAPSPITTSSPTSGPSCSETPSAQPPPWEQQTSTPADAQDDPVAAMVAPPQPDQLGDQARSDGLPPGPAQPPVTGSVASGGPGEASQPEAQPGFGSAAPESQETPGESPTAEPQLPPNPMQDLGPPPGSPSAAGSLPTPEQPAAMPPTPEPSPEPAAVPDQSANSPAGAGSEPWPQEEPVSIGPAGAPVATSAERESSAGDAAASPSQSDQAGAGEPPSPIAPAPEAAPQQPAGGADEQQAPATPAPPDSIADAPAPPAADTEDDPRQAQFETMYHQTMDSLQRYQETGDTADLTAAEQDANQMANDAQQEMQQDQSGGGASDNDSASEPEDSAPSSEGNQSTDSGGGNDQGSSEGSP